MRALAPRQPAPLLVVHDRGDDEVPWQHGLHVTQAWSGAELLTTEGYGHRRLLKASGVVAAAVDFLVARATAASTQPQPRHAGPPTPHAA